MAHDGGVVVIGDMASPGGDISVHYGSVDGWLIKLDTLGNVVWDFTIGSQFLDLIASIEKTDDNGFLVGGLQSPYYSIGGNIECQNYIDSAFQDASIYKLDSLGQLQWQQCYGTSYIDQVFCILELESGYLL